MTNLRLSSILNGCSLESMSWMVSQYIFYRTCWDFIKDDLVKVFHEFHERGILQKGAHSNFIALIPNKKGICRVSDFKPISLIGSMYKIMPKVLSCRLRLVMSNIISNSQSTFINGSQIMNGILVANECMDSGKKSASRGLIYKIDLEKRI